MNEFCILLIDDEESQLESLKSFLERRGFKVFTANNGLEGLRIVSNNIIDLVLTDFRMPEISGLSVIEKVKEINPNIDAVVMTAYSSVTDAVNIMKAGAYDYLVKPIDLNQLLTLIERIQEKQFLISENKMLKEKLYERRSISSIISSSKEMEEVLSAVYRVADSKATVLIRGESGTGKELIANAIHYSGIRKDKPMITVNIAALSENLLESELFGHEKGAYTGAINSRIGKFEAANTGTIFIDEVGEIPIQIQVKLLRVIQFGEVERVGSDKKIKTDVRIIAATHRNLEEMVSKGEFREDLYYRLNVITLSIPPLRKRRGDVELLIDFFLKKYNEIYQKSELKISKEALDKLRKYDYPGNVRELENIIERAVVLSRQDLIVLKNLPPSVLQMSQNNSPDLIDGDINDLSYEDTMKTFETDLILKALNQANANQSAAARLLKISERHFRSRMERLGLKRNEK